MDPVSVTVLLLAAGRSTRMGPAGTKLLARFDGVPLVRRAAEAALASRARGVVAVVGHRAEDIGAALAGLPLTLVNNPDYSEGLASSLRAGWLTAVPATGILVQQADMPNIGSRELDALIAAFEAADGQAVVWATGDGRRGNPLILPERLGAAVLGLSGDRGARRIVEESELDIVEVEIGPAAHLDLDTVEAVLAAGGQPEL